MNIFKNMKEGIREKMRSFLQIEKAQDLQVNILENMDEETKTIKNIIWYRGDTFELSQLYNQLPNKNDTFWGSVATTGLEIRKIHTGIASLIVDTLTYIIKRDYNGIDFDKDEKHKKEWEKIEEENNFNDLLEEAVSQGLYKGEGAFKVSFDPEISQLPIIEYFPKDKIEIIRKRNRIREIIFKTILIENDKQYLLKEIYGYGYIVYKLIDIKDNKEISIKNIKQTKNLENVKFDGAEINENGDILRYGSFMLAVPFKIKKEAIYDKKTDNFDAFDEVWSQWMNALRDGRSKEYIPECLLPRNPSTGEIIRPNSFDNKYIKTEDDANENGKNEIKVVQPEIPTDSYMNAYVTALDLALQGLISPSTLGIDTKKITDPNATAQREKEKATLYTRGIIVEALEKTIPKLVNIVFKAQATNEKQSIEEIKSHVKIGEYANPSFEAQVETIGKGKQQGVLSIEATVEELYGDSKSDEWKKTEVKRLKAEQGVIDLEQPAIDFDLEMKNTTNANNIVDKKQEKKVDE